jgi:hypothetical protein
MELKSYFANAAGLGILSTADGHGHVDAAVYSRPHVMEDGTVAFIMRDRLSHHNLRSNPHAAYLFKENGPGYKGRRLFLTKVSEEKESPQLYELRRKSYPEDKDRREVKYLVFFRVNEALPLIGPARGSSSGAHPEMANLPDIGVARKI